MFNIPPPKILAHKKVLDKGNFVLDDYIIHKSDLNVKLFKRYCPHRMYPLHDTGEIVNNISCKFHNFKWTFDGQPVNNNKNLSCGNAQIGKSGLVSINLNEPNHRWVDELAQETNLVYSHSYTGKSHGSYLWLMDAEADLLHVYENGIHPFLSKQIKLDNIKMDQGDGWILQDHPDGWWLYIFPFTFVEYGRPGMVMVNNITPNNENSEFGFSWITQFYYDPLVSVDRRMIFETLDTVFKEDVCAAEKQKGPYFPLMKAMNQYEDHCVHFGNWIRNNRKTI